MAKKTSKKKWPSLEQRIARIKGLIASSEAAAERSNSRVAKLKQHLERLENKTAKKEEFGAAV